MNTQQNTQDTQKLQQQQYAGENNANKEVSSNEELIKREDVKDTPFTLIYENGKWKITMGMFKLSEEVETKEELLKAIKQKPWELMFNVITAISETVTKMHLNKNLNENS